MIAAQLVDNNFANRVSIQTSCAGFVVSLVTHPKPLLCQEYNRKTAILVSIFYYLLNRTYFISLGPTSYGF